MRERAEVQRANLEFGRAVRDTRLARRWTLRELAERARLSAATIYAVEAGEAASSETHTRLALALGRRFAMELIETRRRPLPRDLGGDLVHSAMGEFEARHLRGSGFRLGLDEPYQHYQFAGRADLVAWDVERRALLHIENRTRFPDFQEMAGAFNAKRAYLGEAVAARAGVDRWASETHVIAALWSSEVLHALRLRAESFRAICPDEPARFADWWAGRAPESGSGSSATSTLIVLDPLARLRQRAFVGFGRAMTVRPRHRGYAEVAVGLAQGRRPA